MSIANGPGYLFSGTGNENSWTGRALFLAVACLALGVGCGARAVATPATVDGSTGGSTVGSGGSAGGSAGGSTGGSTGSGGLGSGGRTGGTGGTSGTGGSLSTDGGINCSLVGCGAPPLCSVGCHEVCGCCPCASGSQSGNLVCTGGCYVPVAADASVDGTTDGSVDAAALCEGIKNEYATALHAAQECSVGASNQCGMQVRASFFCNCTTFANSGADTLAAIVTRFQTSGCLNVCGGVCAQQQPLSCLPDTTSSTGGRCQRAGLLNLAAANNGGTFSVSVDDEVDITLESIAPGSYSTDIQMSSDIATVLEVTIPAGAPNPNGPTRLYRLRALSAGQVQLQISFEPAASGSPRPIYAVTITAH